MSESAETTPARRIIRCQDTYALPIRALLADAQPRVIKARVLDSIEDAGDALHAAHEEAMRIVADAHAEADALRAQAADEAREAAWAEILDELTRARAEYDRLITEAEQDMLELAFGIASRIIRARLELDPTTIREIVAGALEHVRGKRQVVIVVHPDDRATLEAARAQLDAQAEGARIYIDEDARLERGDCVLETESGRVDARLSVQLDVLKRALARGRS